MTVHVSRARLRALGAGLIVPAVLIALWQTVATLGWTNEHVLPSPVAVVQRWVAYLLPQIPYSEATTGWLAWAVSGELPIDAMGSMYRVVVGFLIGAGLALPLGLTMGVRVPRSRGSQSWLALSTSYRRTSASVRGTPTLNCTVSTAMPGRATE